MRADAPAVTLNTDYNSDGSVTVSGQVASVAPGNLTVTLTGGVNAQVTTAEDGTFSYTTTAYMFGNVQATTTDPWGQQSAPAQATLTPAAPVISLNPPVYGPNGSVTLSGQVTANDPGNLTVTLTGMVNTQVTTNPDGTFSYTTTTWGLGDVQATTTDTWGQGSNAAHVTLTNTAPVITGFAAYEQPDNMWTFEGQVTDEWAPGLNVRLGGLPSLPGASWWRLGTTGGSVRPCNCSRGKPGQPPRWSRTGGVWILRCSTPWSVRATSPWFCRAARRGRGKALTNPFVIPGRHRGVRPFNEDHERKELIMYDQDLTLDELAAAAQTGDPEAVAAYKNNSLEPEMRLMVRRVVMTGSCSSALSQRIQAEIARTVPPGWCPAGPDQEKVVIQVARRLRAAQTADQVQDRRALSSRETVFC